MFDPLRIIKSLDRRFGKMYRAASTQSSQSLMQDQLFAELGVSQAAGSRGSDAGGGSSNSRMSQVSLSVLLSTTYRSQLSCADASTRLIC